MSDKLILNSLGETPRVVQTSQPINWREQIPAEFLYVNKEWFTRNHRPVPASIEGLEDHQLLVKLGGIKHVAKLHGYESVRYRVVKAELDHVVVVCSIDWRSGVQSGQDEFKSQIETYDGIGAAHAGNTGAFMVNFLEATAENRAFVRAVRNYLGINVVGDDEINRGGNNVQEEPRTVAPSMTPVGQARQAAADLGLQSIEEIQEHLTKAGASKDHVKALDGVKTLDEVPVKSLRVIIGILKK